MLECGSYNFEIFSALIPPFTDCQEGLEEMSLNHLGITVSAEISPREKRKINVPGNIRLCLDDVAPCFFTKHRTEWDVIEISECDLLTPKEKKKVCFRAVLIYNDGTKETDLHRLRYISACSGYDRIHPT